MPVGDVGEYRDAGCEFQPRCLTCSLPKCILEIAAVGIQRLYEQLAQDRRAAKVVFIGGLIWRLGSCPRGGRSHGGSKILG